MKTRGLLIAAAYTIATALLFGCDGPSSPALKETLLATLREYLHACVDGDAQQFRALRDPDEIKRIEAVLAARGEVLSPQHITPQTPQSGLRLLDYPVIQVTTKDDFARLALLNKNATEMGHGPGEVEIVFVLFRKRNRAWRIVRFGPSVLAKSDLGPQNRFAEEHVPWPFRVPR